MKCELCNTDDTIFVKSGRGAYDGGEASHRVRICAGCGLFAIDTTKNGQQSTIKFTINDDKALDAAGRYLERIEGDVPAVMRIHRLRLDESQRQMVLLALHRLVSDRTGWGEAVKVVTDMLGGQLEFAPVPSRDRIEGALITIATEACSELQAGKNPRESLKRVMRTIAFGFTGDSNDADAWLGEWLETQQYPLDLLGEEPPVTITSAQVDAAAKCGWVLVDKQGHEYAPTETPDGCLVITLPAGADASGFTWKLPASINAENYSPCVVVQEGTPATDPIGWILVDQDGKQIPGRRMPDGCVVFDQPAWRWHMYKPASEVEP